VNARRARGWLAGAWLVSCVSLASAQAQTSEVPDQVRARECFNAAQAAYLAGKLDEARHGFECAYALMPSPELVWNLARVCERMGDVEAGVHYFREYLLHAKVSAKERKGIEARIRGLLDLQARQSVHLNAGADVHAALSGEARTFFQRGVKLYRAGQFDAAAAAFGQAWQLSNAPELHYNLAMTAQQLGHIEEAYDHYRAYLSALPEALDRREVEARVADLRAQLP
jgi:tetratricopeptide (TPR) repeat protein